MYVATYTEHNLLLALAPPTFTVISYVYGCQKTFSNSSPDWCNINCRFACETPQLQRYSLTVFDTQGRQQDSVTTSLRRNIRIPCDFEVVEIETQGLDGDGNELRLPSVITEGPESTLTTDSNEAEPTSSLTTPNSTPSEIPGSSLTTASTSSASETATSSLPMEVRAGLDQGGQRMLYTIILHCNTSIHVRNSGCHNAK